MSPPQATPDIRYQERNEQRARFHTSVWELFVPYWKYSSERWVSGLLALFVVTIGFVEVYYGVWRNGWTGQFYDAVGAQQFATLFPLLSKFIVIVLLNVCALLLSMMANALLQLRWRTWLTAYLVDKWTHNETYYRIERDKILDNADQRIAEDAHIFTQKTCSLVLSFIRVPVSIVTYGALLYQLSGDFPITIGDTGFAIPGYLVIFALLYSGGILLLTHLFGRKLIPLNFAKQKAEADYRSMLIQVREGSEQIALYGGGKTEATRLKINFEAVKDTTWQMVLVQRNLLACMLIPGSLNSIIPTLLSLPLMATGAWTLGTMMKITAAFVSLEVALGFFPGAYDDFAAWRAVVRRMLSLLDAVEPAEPVQGLALETRDDAAIEIESLTLAGMDGTVLARVPAFRIEPGARCLIRGASGSGKTTLLRAIAGLWPYGQGTIRRPERAAMMFVPQKSYLPVGTLKQALCFPGPDTEVPDARARQALIDCDLHKYADALHEPDRWGRRLSGGEQQRLAFARILLQRPTHVFLDEATSALDEASEHRLYSRLLEALPGSTLVSVAHRKEVARYHDQFVDLVPVAPEGAADAATATSEAGTRPALGLQPRPAAA